MADTKAHKTEGITSRETLQHWLTVYSIARAAP